MLVRQVNLAVHYRGSPVVAMRMGIDGWLRGSFALRTMAYSLPGTT